MSEPISASPLLTTQQLLDDLELCERTDVLQKRADATQRIQGREAYTTEAVVMLGHSARTGWPAAIRTALALRQSLAAILALTAPERAVATATLEEIRRLAEEALA